MANFISLIAKNKLIALAIVFLILGIIAPFIVKWIYYTLSYDNLGPIGDWFGGIANPLIGLASFLIVYSAFDLQRDNNLSQQTQIESQNNNLNLQRFEATFFQLLTFHHEITRSLTIPVKSKLEKSNKSDPPEGINLDLILSSTAEFSLLETSSDSTSKNFFNLSMEILNEYYKFEINKINPSSINLESKKYAMFNAFNKFYNDNESSLGHYFRNLYHITKYISNSNLIESQEKSSYIGIFRAQLSAYELVLLMYNCCIPELGYPNFRKLLLKNLLLKNMNQKLLLDPDHLIIFNQLPNE